MLLVNVRHAARLLVRSPVFSLAAVASLAIGIGANTAIFTAANTLLLAPTTGIADMDRLVDIGRTRPNEPFDTLSFLTYRDVASRTDVFEGVYAIRMEPQPASVGGADGAERAWVEQVSASYFEVLGVRPALGTVFRGSEEQIGVPLRQVVLSHAYWQRRFASDPAVIGHELLVNGEPFSVIGVAGAGYRGTTILAPDFWVPMTAHARGLSTEELLRSRGANWLVMGARLRPGVTLDQARQAMSAFMQQLAAQYPDVYRPGTGLAVLPASRVPGFGPTYVAPFFALLMGLVGLVLLVACANVAGLLLARATSRSREIAVRLALGASRGSLIALLTTESLLLFAVGSIAAIGLSRLMLSALTSLLNILPVPVHLDMPLDWRVLAFTGGLALLTGTVTGLVPAWRSARADLLTDIKAANATPRRQRLRQVFVAAQLACCLVLTAVAGLLLRALDRAHQIDPGMQVDGVQVATFDLALAGYQQDRFADVTDRLGERLRALPGVAQVAAAQMTPLDGGGLGLGPLRPEGAPDPADRIDADWNVISPDFLVTLGIPVLQGRPFTAADRPGAPNVAIVNQRFAALAWPGQDPVGRRLENGDFRPGREQTIRRLTVVGVARDSKYRWIGEAPRAFIYVPLAQQPDRRVHFFLRVTPGAPSDLPLHASVRAALKAFDPNLPLVQMMPLRDYANVSLLPQRLAASVAGSLGAVALLLSALGVYGVTAYAVASRTREIGIRIALGADRRGVIGLLLRRVMTLTAIASAIGLAAALGAAQLLSGLLMGVSAVDPVAFVGTSMLLAVTALAATIGPARRAASIDPVQALKHE
jgi:predicted permease